MDNLRQINTELWPLIGVVNLFSILYLWHFFTDFLQTLHEKVYFQNGFLCIENIPWRGMLHACSTFISLEKLGIINFLPKSVRRPSVCPYVYPSVCPSGQGQTIFFLVNASPPKQLNVATTKFAGVNVL